MVRHVLSLCALLLVGGCAWTSEAVDVRRQAVPVVMVPGAKRISVTVIAADARQEREISHKKNGYGMRAADISASNDVIAEIRSGIETILADQGFLPGGNATVRVEVSRFYNTFDLGFWSAVANAQATASLSVTAADGRTLYARIYTGTHQIQGVQLMSADNAGTALRAAMHSLLRQIADDPQLSQALLQANPPSALDPAEPVRRPRGRPTT